MGGARIDRGPVVTDDAPQGLEIERVFLLRGMPPLPPAEEVWEIEQGYLPRTRTADGGWTTEGRLRRVRSAGRTRCFLTRKRGEGLVREETEREIPEAEFERRWGETAERRLRKVRHRVRSHGNLWEIDRFLDLPLVLAEVELPHPDAVVAPPPWLSPWIVREVTEDPRYRNSALAFGGGLPPVE